MIALLSTGYYLISTCRAFIRRLKEKVERALDSSKQCRSDKQDSIRVVRISRVSGFGLYFIEDGGSFSFSWMNLVDFVVVIKHRF